MILSKVGLPTLEGERPPFYPFIIQSLHTPPEPDHTRESWRMIQNQPTPKVLSQFQYISPTSISSSMGERKIFWMRNWNRFEIYRYIQTYRGAYYSEIMNGLDLPSGVTSYHIQKLIRDKMIRRENDGILTRFYPNGRRSRSNIPTSKQSQVLKLISKRKGLCTTEIARLLGKSRQAIMHHLKNLSGKGFVESRSEGRKLVWYRTGKRK